MSNVTITKKKTLNTKLAKNLVFFTLKKKKKKDYHTSSEHFSTHKPTSPIFANFIHLAKVYKFLNIIMQKSLTYISTHSELL